MRSHWKPRIASVVNWKHPISHGIKGCYLFNEGGGTETYDQSGHNYTGTLTSATTVLWSPGPFGPCCLLNDTSTSNISMPSAMDSGSSVTALSMSIWVNAISFPNSYQQPIGGNGTNATRQLLVKSTGKLAIYITASGGGVDYDGSGTYTLSTHTWYHITYTYDSVGGLKGYVNGKLDGSVGANGIVQVNASPFYIGTDPVNSGRYWNGYVDLPMVWGRALSAAEVLELYESPFCFIRPSTVIPIGATLAIIINGSANLVSESVVNTSDAGHANLVNTSTLTVEASVTHIAKANLVSTSILGATASVTHIAKANLVSTSILGATASVTHIAKTNLVSTSILGATASVTHIAKTNLVSTSLLITQASVISNAKANLVATMVLIANVIITATLASTSTLSANGEKSYNAKSVLTSSSQLSATATKLYTAAITSSFVLSANAQGSYKSKSVLTNSWSLSATATKRLTGVSYVDNFCLNVVNASVHLANTSILSVTATKYRNSGSVLTSSWSLSAKPTKRLSGVSYVDNFCINVASAMATLAGTFNLTAIPGIITGVSYVDNFCLNVTSATATLDGSSILAARLGEIIVSTAGLIVNSAVFLEGNITYQSQANLIDVSSALESTPEITRGAQILLENNSELAAVAMTAHGSSASLISEVILTPTASVNHPVQAQLTTDSVMYIIIGGQVSLCLNSVLNAVGTTNTIQSEIALLMVNDNYIKNLYIANSAKTQLMMPSVPLPTLRPGYGTIYQPTWCNIGGTCDAVLCAVTQKRQGIYLPPKSRNPTTWNSSIAQLT